MKYAKKDNSNNEFLDSDIDTPYMDSSKDEDWEIYCKRQNYKGNG